jgi:hypothetical protein
MGPPENTEWKPKTDLIPGAEFRLWLGSEDIEVLGYVYALLGDHRFLVGPELSLEEYLTFIRRYYLVALSRTPMASGPTAGIPQAGIWLVS